MGMHPAAGEGLWGTQREVPSFLYAMPSSSGRVFLEETCLVAKPALPFATLKRRLHRRMAAMGLKVRPPPPWERRYHSCTMPGCSAGHLKFNGNRGGPNTLQLHSNLRKAATAPLCDAFWLT